MSTESDDEGRPEEVEDMADRALDRVGDTSIQPLDPARLPVAELPSATPTRTVRAVAFTSIAIAGLCGGLIGYAFTDLQCDDGCATLAGFGALVGAVVAAVGVAIVAVLVMRAMDEWSTVERRRDP